MRRFALCLIFVFGFSTACLAQPFLCDQEGVNPTLIKFVPPAPNASQVIAITVGDLYYAPISAVAALQGNSIDVTLTARRWVVGLPPPLECATAYIGPLTAGSYHVNLFVLDLNAQQPASVPNATTTLQ